MLRFRRPAFLCCLLFCLTVMLCACVRKTGNETPKPMAYFRIDIPEHRYVCTDTALPFRFERSAETNVAIFPKEEGVCWIDLDYPALDATLKLTYLPIRNADSLRDLIIREDKMVKFHYQKAEDVEYSIIKDAGSRLWGQVYDIEGRDVATPFIFWMTDSSRHFLRGSLYFNFTPNNDSLEPVIKYLREDAMHFFNTFQWK